ncbi:hypothetical protein, partial [Streptomyces palmae]
APQSSETAETAAAQPATAVAGKAASAKSGTGTATATTPATGDTATGKTTPATAGTTTGKTTPTTPAETTTGSTTPTSAETTAATEPATAAPAKTSSTGTAPAAAPQARTAAAAATATAAEAAQATRTAAESTAEARLAAAADSAPAGRRTAVLPLGRPKKPMIAAAVLGGLVLVGVPFLVSGPDHKSQNSSTERPAGSRLNPDGSGDGLIPGEQRVAATGPAKGKGGEKGERQRHGKGGGPGGTGTAHDGSDLGGIHESGTTSGKDGSRTGSSKEKDPGKESDKKTTGSDAPAQDQPTSPTKKAPPAQGQAPVTYSHLIGPGCNTPGFAVGDMYTDGDEGWRGSRGSTTGYGCSGFYYSMPMSGANYSDGIWAQWKFTTGSVEKGTCSVQVYIPNVRDLSYVGGTPAHYTVYKYFAQSSSNKVGSFEINQPAHLGQWVSAGTFPISANKISVVLDNRGSGADNRHAAAAPVRVECKAT